MNAVEARQVLEQKAAQSPAAARLKRIAEIIVANRDKSESERKQAVRDDPQVKELKVQEEQYFEELVANRARPASSTSAVLDALRPQPRKLMVDSINYEIRKAAERKATRDLRKDVADELDSVREELATDLQKIEKRLAEVGQQQTLNSFDEMGIRGSIDKLDKRLAALAAQFAGLMKLVTQATALAQPASSASAQAGPKPRTFKITHSDGATSMIEDVT
jgi:hypothetical protein